MVATRRSATRVDVPPPLPKPSSQQQRVRKRKATGTAEEDGVAELQATDFADVTMADVTVTDVVHVPSGSGRMYAGKASSVPKSEGTSKRKLDVSESEAEEATSETPTGDIRSDDDESMSELSSLDDTAVELTPKPVSKPLKKKPREVSPVNLGKPMVNAMQRSGASNIKASVSGSAGASHAFRMSQDDLAAWMGVPPSTATAKVTKPTATSGSTSGHDAAHSMVPPHTSDRPARTLPSRNSSSVPSKEVARASQSVDVLPPGMKAGTPPVHAKPRKASQPQPLQTKQKIDKSNKAKGKQRAKTGVVGSDDEEPERVAALSSPPKGGARPTSTHVIKIKEEPDSPRPAKLSIHVVEPTPRKNVQETQKPVDNKRGRKVKPKVISKSEDERSSDVEIIEDAPQTLKPPRSQQSRSRSRSQSASRSKTWCLEHIPEAAQSRWRSEVLPILLRFQGARHEPWTFVDSRSVRAVQQVWDFVYGDQVPHQVVAGDCVHGFANQCMYNWRSAIRAAAESVVGSFFEGNAMTRTLEGRATFSNKILEGKRYLYENPFDPENTRLFRSVFFLTILGWHLDATKNAAEVPGLFDKTIRPEYPIGVIGLAAAALERIFMLFDNRLMRPPISKNGKPPKGLWRVIAQMNPITGVTSKNQTEFSERRFSGRTTYFMTCANKMTANRFNGVLVAAQEYTGPARLDAITTAAEPDGDEELLVDGDSE